MFNFFRKDSSEKKELRVDLSLLDNSSRSYKLIVKGRKLTDEAKNDLKEKLGPIRPVQYASNLQEEIDSTVSIFSFQIVHLAMNNLNISLPYPEEKFSKEFIASLVFLIFTSDVISRFFENEDNEPSKEVLIKSTQQLFILHEPKQIIDVIKVAFKIYEKLLDVQDANVVQWRESVNKIVWVYLLILIDEEKDISLEKTENVIPSLLETLIKAVD